MTDMPAPAPSGSGARRQRMSAEEVRDRMLTAATEIVMDRGMTVSLEDMSVEEVMRHAQVPRSSVYRLWPYRGDFIDDLLCHLAKPEWVGVAAVGQQRTFDVVDSVLRANANRLATPEGRMAVLRETARQAVLCNFEEMITAKGWTFYFALASTIDYVRDPEARARIAAALEDCEATRIRGLVDFYRKLADILGLRLRAGYRFEHLALAGGALLQALLLRMTVARNSPNDQSVSAVDGIWTAHRLITEPLPGPGLDTPVTEWSFAASTYFALFEAVLELDPDATPSGVPAKEPPPAANEPTGPGQG